MAVTVEQLQEQINTISKQVSQRFAQQQTTLIQNQMRLESLIRMIMIKQSIPFDDYFEYIDAYVTFTNKLAEVNKLQGIKDRVAAAQEFNDKALVRIYADDLNLLPVIQSTGSVSIKLLNQIYTLPHSGRFKEALTAILFDAEKEEVSKEN